MKNKIIDKKINNLRNGIVRIKRKIKDRGVKSFNSSLAQWKAFLITEGFDKCNICGYDRCLDTIDAHHLEPKNKLFGISNYISHNYYSKRTLKVLISELDKCIPLCSNCHRELHHGWRKVRRR